MKNFPERLKQLRLNKGCSQHSIAVDLGVYPRTYQRYESGENTPSFEVINKMANFFKVSADYLLGLDENYNSDESRLLTAFESLNADNKRTLLEMADFLNSRQATV